MENANVSLLVKDPATNETLYQFRPKNSNIPASILKLVTTATALEMLGPDFCFETKLEIDGTVSADSVLNGNLYIHGGGDPSLGSECFDKGAFFEKWVEAVKKAGIKTITGQIVADASLYDDQGVNPKWIWEDLGNYYAAGAYGISYLDNTFRLVLRSGKVGTVPEIVNVIPEIPGLTFDNHLLSSTIDFDSAYFYGGPHVNYRGIYGEIPAFRSSFVVKGDIPNPALLLAQHFHAKLVQNGFLVSGLPTDKVNRQTTRKVIYTHDSPLLSEIITETNVNSNNHYAEQIFRYLALKNNHTATTTDALQVIKSYWESRGLPVEQLVMYDGSGLSPVNTVSAQFIVDLLSYMKTKSQNSKIFYQSLSVSGEVGTLSSFLKDTFLQGKVHGKSGTISRVKCCAGYIDVKGKSYVFALMVNNANGTPRQVSKKIEEFLLAIAK